jgi:hypothetical protein
VASIAYQQYRDVRKLLRNVSVRQTVDGVSVGDIVRLCGRIEASDSSLEAPLSGSESVFFEVTVEERGSPEPIIHTVHTAEFTVACEAGRVQVPSKCVRVFDATETWFECGWLNDAGPTLEAFLVRHGQSSKRDGILYVNRSLSCCERRLVAGDTIELLGLLGLVTLGEVTGVEQDPTTYREAPKAVRGPATIMLEPLAEGLIAVSKTARRG